jgi:two-component system copper resistance phosphate regulon response regulator CusR
MLAKGLRQASYAVDVAGDGKAALEKVHASSYDLVILDVRLPEVDGWRVCAELRQANFHRPILMLSASGSTDQRIKGLDLGADDYLVKPFDFAELLARVRALLRRQPVVQSSVITVDTLQIDTRSRTVTRNGTQIRLTGKEYALLECLAREAGTVLDRATISQRVWDEYYDPFSNLIEEYIKRLRKKLDVPGQAPLIHSRRGQGYVLYAEQPSQAQVNQTQIASAT